MSPGLRAVVERAVGSKERGVVDGTTQLTSGPRHSGCRASQELMDFFEPRFPFQKKGAVILFGETLVR